MKVQTQASSRKDDPFSSMTGQMGKWINHVLGAGYYQYARDVWSPAVNVYEDSAHYHVVVDLAGIKCDSIDLHFENSQLVLTGMRETPRPDDGGQALQTHLMEIDHGRFLRAIELPVPVDGAGIRARYCNGLLWIELPKKTQP